MTLNANSHPDINDFCPLDTYVPSITLNGESWIYASEACRALQLDETVIDQLDAGDVLRLRCVSNAAEADTDEDDALLISEPAYHLLVFRSDVPAAMRFTDKVMRHVASMNTKNKPCIPFNVISPSTLFAGNFEPAPWWDEINWSGCDDHYDDW